MGGDTWTTGPQRGKRAGKVLVGGGGGGRGDEVNTDTIHRVPTMTSTSEYHFMTVTHMSSVREISFEVQLTR